MSHGQKSCNNFISMKLLFQTFLGNLIVLVALIFNCRIILALCVYTGLFKSPSGNSELDCATTKIDTADRSISIGRESLQVLFILGALAYFPVPPLRGSREEKWHSQ